jgi:hypothetical protein
MPRPNLLKINNSRRLAFLYFAATGTFALFWAYQTPTLIFVLSIRVFVHAFLVSFLSRGKGVSLSVIAVIYIR